MSVIVQTDLNSCSSLEPFLRWDERGGVELQCFKTESEMALVSLFPKTWLRIVPKTIRGHLSVPGRDPACPSFARHSGCSGIETA